MLPLLSFYCGISLVSFRLGFDWNPAQPNISRFSFSWTVAVRNGWAELLECNSIFQVQNNTYFLFYAYKAPNSTVAYISNICLAPHLTHRDSLRKWKIENGYSRDYLGNSCLSLGEQKKKKSKRQVEKATPGWLEGPLNEQTYLFTFWWKRFMIKHP